MNKNQIIFSILFASLFLFSCVKNAEETDSDEVVKLTTANFKEFIEKHEFVLVKFFSPDCIHCQTLAPKFAAAAKKLKAEKPPVYLVRVDATEEEELSNQYEIQHYPTLKFFINGETVEYKGTREEDDIIRWVKKKIGTSSLNIENADSLKKFQANNEVGVIYFGKKADEEEFKTYQKVTKQLDGVEFAHSFSIDLAKSMKKLDVDALPTIFLFKTRDESTLIFDGKFTESNLLDFIETNQFSLILPFNDVTSEKIFVQEITTMFLLINKDEVSNKARLQFEKAASNLGKKQKILYCMTGIEDEMGRNLGEFLGLATSDLPKVIIISFGNNQVNKYFYEQDAITEEGILTFFKDWKAGKIQKFLKSEEAPEKNNGPVIKVVGKTFEDIVLNPKRDVLLKFYAPYCSHCQDLAPIYEKVAKRIRSVAPKVVVADFDATLNEIDVMDIEGYPTIRFYPSDAKDQYIDYNGDRTEDDIIDFIRENTRFAWKEAPLDDL